MRYRTGYKYQVAELVEFETSIFPDRTVSSAFFTICTNGTIKVLQGYAWDGSTWAVDTPESQSASLVHDILCQAIQDRLLDKKWKTKADLEYYYLCVKNGMWRIRAGARLLGIQFHSWQNTKPKTVIEVP